MFHVEVFVSFLLQAEIMSFFSVLAEGEGHRQAGPLKCLADFVIVRTNDSDSGISFLQTPGHVDYRCQKPGV